MQTIRLPRTASSRGFPCYSKLLCRVHPEKIPAFVFEGILHKCGTVIDRNQLWPDKRYPEKPLLLEWAGKDRPGRRALDVHILWRFEPDFDEWVELTRTITRGTDWVSQLAAIALKELGGRPLADPDTASRAAASVLQRVDEGLRELAAADRVIALDLVYEQILARIVDTGPILDL